MLDRPVDGTAVGVDAMHPFRDRALLGTQPQVVADVNAADHEDVAVLLDLTSSL